MALFASYAMPLQEKPKVYVDFALLETAPSLLANSNGVSYVCRFDFVSHIA
jgi:hypothetical protein